MRSTRKKVIKTVYKDENSDEEEGGDFSDSGSDAKFSGASSSEEEEIESEHSSADEFINKSNAKTRPKNQTRKIPPNKTKFAKNLIKKINKQLCGGNEEENIDVSPAVFSIKDLTEADKLLPPILNLSESDSSDDEAPNTSYKSNITALQHIEKNNDSDNDVNTEYKDVWSNNMQVQDDSEEIAKRTFMELEQHKSKIEETKATLKNYTLKMQEQESNVKDLLALGEEVLPTPEVSTVSKKPKFKRRKNDSDSEMEDWEEVKDTKAIPQQGIELFVEFPDAACRKSKKIDVEMMMRRKINRVKKEYQVYMHKVHVLCWLAHGNYVSQVLNNQELMAAALSLVPSKECYPGERVDMKYVEQITTWYKDKLTIKQDKNEDKFKPKAPPLRTILLELIKKRVVTSKKYLVFIFVAMLRALGLQCRIMFNFVTLPLKPPHFELCSLSTKPKDKNTTGAEKAKSTAKSPSNKIDKKENKGGPKASSSKAKPKKQQIAQVDGNYDSCFSDEEIDISDCSLSDSDYENILQVDGNDDNLTTRKTRSTKRPKADTANKPEEDVSPPKISRKSPGRNSPKPIVNIEEKKNPQKGKKIMDTNKEGDANDIHTKPDRVNVKDPPKSLGRKSPKPPTKPTVNIDNKKSQRGKKTIGTTEKDDANDTDTNPSSSNVKIPTESLTHGLEEEEDVSPPKIPRRNLARKPPKPAVNIEEKKNTQRGKKTIDTKEKSGSNDIVTKPNSSNFVDSSKGPEDEGVSQSKLQRKSPGRKSPKPSTKTTVNIANKNTAKDKKACDTEGKGDASDVNSKLNSSIVKDAPKSLTRGQKSQLENGNIDLQKNKNTNSNNTRSRRQKNDNKNIPEISVTDENKKEVASKYFEDTKPNEKLSRLSRKRSHTANPNTSKSANKIEEKTTDVKAKSRTKSAPGTAVEKSKYFDNDKAKQNTPKKPIRKIKEELSEDKQRVSHRDLVKNNKKGTSDVTGDLVDIIKNRIKDAKSDAKKGLVKGKIKAESGEDSDYLPVEDPKRRNSDSDDDFKPSKISPKPSTSRRIDRRVLSSSTIVEPVKKIEVDVWCEIFVEELEQWIAVDVIKGKIHSTEHIYNNATKPLCYAVGWDNNNYLKDLTRKYVPQYHTFTRKFRAEQSWWDKAVRPYLAPTTARGREEDEYLDKMQLEAPIPKTVSEYKNHPLYALKRHLLKFEVIYPPDAAVLGFVRGEEVYARECVYTCRSRDTWLKEAKVVKLGEKPYKVVKARPKWDKLSNKLITDKPLEVFGPWQVQDYEPPVAVDGIVPRNAYGNVELFKDCMLPKGTVHVKLPGLNRVAKKLNIDCAPAMTGFEFNGGWSHPVYDGFVVCQEFEEIVTDAWVKDQEEQERREREKTELRVYGNWKRLIKGLIIRERLKNKYGFEEPTTSGTSKGKSKGPKLVVKKRS